MPVNESDRAWSIPPELEQPLPRRLRLDSVGILHCVLGVACLAFGIYETPQIIKPELRRQAENESPTRQLNAEGRETEGTVTEMFSAMGPVIFFKYTVDGRNYGGGAPIASNHWRSLQIGSPLTVRYLPSDPSKSAPADDLPNSQNNWDIVLPLCGMMWFFMLSFAAINLSALFPKHRLLRRGRPARGIVTCCKEGSKYGNSGFFVDYDFPLPDGSLGHGKAFRRYEEEEGSAVTVLYDIHRPQRSILYPLSQTVWEIVGTPEVLSILQ